MADRRILLGMPGYGKQTSAAGRGFWRACADMSHVVNASQEGSLLASNFNQIWCHGLNIVHQGGRLDYFAMLHDDIGPEDFWLDKLIDELEERQLDILGVAVPIKDTRGMTSMALHKEGDNWMPLTRLSMHDVYQLPETFTSADLPAPLLLNTGCWVAKWNQDWCREVHFEINDRIVFNTAVNRYQAQTEPEDWFFSRLCHEIGLKIGCTRKVAVRHRGDMDFTNEKPWGTNTYDKESATCSPVPGAHPFEVPGWLYPAEGKALAELAHGKRVLEIGSYCGLSTIYMARTAEHVTAMDYFDGRGTPTPRNTLRDFTINIDRYGLTEKVTICNPDETPPLLDYDLVFIDGAHDYESVKADIAKALTLLAPGGVLAFHDYNEHTDPGVPLAVNEFLANGGELLATHETLAVVKPPALILSEV
jgi:SAM-dependent methyltransferase